MIRSKLLMCSELYYLHLHQNVICWFLVLLILKQIKISCPVHIGELIQCTCVGVGRYLICSCENQMDRHRFEGSGLNCCVLHCDLIKYYFVTNTKYCRPYGIITSGDNILYFNLDESNSASFIHIIISPMVCSKLITC